MPLYDYYCDDCEYQFDDFNPYAERHTSPCPKCSKSSRKLLTIAVGVAIDSTIKDGKGNPIWFPKNESSYFDRALQRTFHSKKEKAAYMKDKGLIMDGSEKNKFPIEAGDMRSKSHRRALKMED